MSLVHDDGIELHAIVTTFRRPTILEATVVEFLAQTRPPDSLTIVDNDADGIVRGCADALGATYLPSNSNLGPAGAIAAGMSHLLERLSSHHNASTWILLIDDDDPPLRQTAVEEMVRFAQSAPADVGAVGLTGSRYNRRTGRLTRVVDDELISLTDVDLIANNQVPLYRLDAIRSTGVFDSTLFFSAEELEYGLRLRAAGWRLCITRDSTLHERAASGRLGLGRTAGSTRRTTPWRSYYAARNEVVIGRRHGRRTAPIVATLRALAGGVRTAVQLRECSLLAARVAGLRDGWLNRLDRRRGDVGDPPNPSSETRE